MFDRKLKTYQQIIEQMADGVCLITLDGKVTYWNKGAEAITGWPAHELSGKSCYDEMLRLEDEEGNALCDLIPSLAAGDEPG